MDQRRVRRLVEAETKAHANLEDRTLTRVAVEIRRFWGWYSPAQVKDLSSRLGRLVRSASRGSAMVTDTYLARVISEMTGGPSKPSGVLAFDAPLRRGVTDYSEVYARLAETYRYHESRDLPPQVALERALDRADAMVRTDLALARRKQAQDTLKSAKVTTYRRVIHPELSESGTCGLCAVASQRVYFVDELLPIHDRCVCTVSPRIGDDDPGLRLNDEDLGRLYEAAGSTSAVDLKQVRIRVEDHGELGPRLVDATHRTKDPGRNRRIREERRPPPVRRPDSAAS